MLGKRFFSIIGLALLGTTIVWLYIQPNWSALLTLLGALILLIEARRASPNTPGDTLSKRLIIQGLSALSIGGSIIWIILQPDFEPVAAFLAGLFGLGSSFAVEDEPITNETWREALLGRSSKSRQRIIQAIRTRWVDDALKSALFQNIYIGMAFDYKDDNGLTVPIDILTAYERAEGKLLVLGEPGAGKSTQMYVLIRDLLSRAEIDEEQPIPILYRLSTWSQKRQSLEKWLCEEVPAFYGMSRNLFQGWLSGSMFQLLLDGLDETPPHLREECVQAINEFIVKYPQTHVIVSCRKSEYEELINKVAIKGALSLAPLTPDVIRRYLEQGGSATEGVRALLETDPSLMGFVTSPLNLNLVARTFENLPVAELPQFETAEKRRAYLFTKYIERMFSHYEQRKPQATYAKHQTLRWLGWLAKQLKENNQTIFPLESIQPNWIKTSFGRILHPIGAAISIFSSSLLSSILVSFLVVLVVFILGATIIDPTYGLGDTIRRASEMSFLTWIGLTAIFSIFIMPIGVTMGFVGILIYSFKKQIKFSETVSFKIEKALLFGAKNTLIFIASAFVSSYTVETWVKFNQYLGKTYISTDNFLGLPDNPLLFYALYLSSIAIWLLVIALPMSIFSGISFSRKPIKIQWETSGTYHGAGLAIIAAVFTIIMGVTETGEGFFEVDVNSLINFIKSSLSEYIFLGFILGVIFGGLSSRELERKTRTNQGFYLSIRNALILQTVIFILVDYAFTIVSIPILMNSSFLPDTIYEFRENNAFMGGVSQLFISGLGLLISWFIAMNNGGAAVIHHLVVRGILWISGNIPFRFSKFLDHTCELVLLRRIGGAYEFTHPLLRDFIAQQY